MDTDQTVQRPKVLAFQPPVQPMHVRDSLTKTVPKARIIPNRVVMSTSGVQYDRWKHSIDIGITAIMYLNYTISFGRYEGGHLEMLRNQDWQSCTVPLIWTEFTAEILEHRVREVTSGERFSVTFFTPSHLERLTERDWMNLESHGFPVHLYPERASAGQLRHQSPEEATTVSMDAVDEANAVTEEVKEDEVKTVQCDAQKAEKVELVQDAMAQLAGQIPQPCMADPVPSDVALERFALVPTELEFRMDIVDLKMLAYPMSPSHWGGSMLNFDLEMRC